MDDNSTSTASGSPVLRWLILVTVAALGVALVRRWALDKADAEFEARLIAADENRN